jgi:hypothetical protein
MSKEKNETLNFNAINAQIKDAIQTTANDDAVARVVEKRRMVEVTRRADTLEKGLDKYNETVKNLTKVKPDAVTCTLEDGVTVPHEAWTPGALQAKQKLEKQVADLDIAIMKAMKENDYSKLEQLLGGAGKQQKSGNDATAE